MKSKKLWFAGTLCAAVLLMIGCEDDSANRSFVPENNDKLPCTMEGATTCDGNDELMVCRSGFYEKDACPSGQKCVADSCRETCNVATYVGSCNGSGARYVCDNGLVASVSCDSGKQCVDGFCTEPVVQTCDPANYKVVCGQSNTRKICDGGKVTEIACDSGKVCVDGSCGEPCTSGFSENCKDSGHVAKCKLSSDGQSGIVVIEACEGGTCEDNHCVVKQVCNPDLFTPSCENDNTRTECGEDHSQKQKNCAIGETCEGGICQSFDESCEDGDVKCISAEIAAKCVEGKFHQYYCSVGEQLCSKGYCVPESSVTKCALDDEPACELNKVVSCEFGVQVKRECSGETPVCLGGKCAQCNPTTFVQTCSDDKETRCDANGNLVTTDCLPGYACSSITNACAKSCESSLCDDHYRCDEESKLCIFEPECDLLSYKPICEGDAQVKSCEAPGLYKISDCTEGAFCDDGKCIECEADTYAGDCVDNSPTICLDGKIIKASECTGATPVCYNGECVACTSETDKHECKSETKEISCENNKYYERSCADNEFCQEGKGCVSKCGADFKPSCDANGRAIVCSADGNPDIKICEGYEECNEGDCVSLVGKPCNYYTYKNKCYENGSAVELLYCDSGDKGIQHRRCNTVGASIGPFCGTIDGVVDCYQRCSTSGSYTCLSGSDYAYIGTCHSGTDYLNNSQNGFIREVGVCRDANLSVSCHLNEAGHAVYDYLYCNMIGGASCDASTRSCSSLNACTVKGGSCSGSTATNCIFDPTQNGGAGALVQTTQTCADNEPCVTYQDDGTTYAVCKKTEKFPFNNGSDTYEISTLGTCLEIDGNHVLGRAFKSGEKAYDAWTIKCTNDCVTNADGFSYCK